MIINNDPSAIARLPTGMEWIWYIICKYLLVAIWFVRQNNFLSKGEKKVRISFSPYSWVLCMYGKSSFPETYSNWARQFLEEPSTMTTSSLLGGRPRILYCLKGRGSREGIRKIEGTCVQPQNLCICPHPPHQRTHKQLFLLLVLRRIRKLLDGSSVRKGQVL